MGSQCRAASLGSPSVGAMSDVDLVIFRGSSAGAVATAMLWIASSRFGSRADSVALGRLAMMA